MSNNTWNKTAVIGGDERQLTAANRLAEGGHEVSVWGISGASSSYGNAVRTLDLTSAIRGAGVVLLPLPMSNDGVRICIGGTPQATDPPELRFTHLLDVLEEGQRVFAGRIPPHFKTAAGERGIQLYDYSENELFQIRNALPTAESAIEIAMRELPVILDGIRAAVIGYGRIGKTLARLLDAFSADVTVAARKSTDLTWIEVNGYHPLPIESINGESSLCALKDCRIIFNTVPHWLFTRSVLSALRPDVLLIDLASAPGGIDPQAASDCEIRVIRALSLPGKCAPETAGIILADTVIAMMTREGIERK